MTMTRKLKIFSFWITLLLFASTSLYAEGTAFLTNRVGNTVTLLPSGDILVTGGQSQTGVPMASVELYEASKATFRTVGDMDVARSSHTATLLPDGRVFIFGGTINAAGDVTNQYTIYNPETASFDSGNFSAIGTASRSGHTATLLKNGKVLACGGFYGTGVDDIRSDCLLITCEKNAATCSAESKELAGPRRDHTATLLPDGNVFLSGGITEGGEYASANEIYDATSNTTMTGQDSLSVPRKYHSALTLSDGRVAILGGYSKDARFSDADSAKYDIYSNDDWYNVGKPGELSAKFHNPGYNNYVDLVEVFDSKGKKSNLISKGDYATIPYRVARAASALDPSGLLLLHGGRGNIPMQYQGISTVFNVDTYLQLEKTTSQDGGGQYSNKVCANCEVKASIVTPASESEYIYVELPETSLSRPVSGKFVNADIFANTADKDGIGLRGGSSDNFLMRTSFWKGEKKHIRMVLDGLPVGRYIDKDTTSGIIHYSSVPVWDVGGTVSLGSMHSANLTFTAAPTITFTDLSCSPSAAPGNPCQGTLSLTGDITVHVPSYFHTNNANNKNLLAAYIQLKDKFQVGVAKNTDASSWDISIPNDGSMLPQGGPEACTNNCIYSVGDGSSFVDVQLLGCPEADGSMNCRYVFHNVTFTGVPFSVVSPTQNFSVSELNTAAKTPLQSFEGYVSLRPDRIHLGGMSYNADVSTIVVRDMFFSNTLAFNPNEGEWKTSTGENEMYEGLAYGWDEDIIVGGDIIDKASPTALVDSNLLITASGSPMIVGGRSCNSTDIDGVYSAYCVRTDGNLQKMGPADPTDPVTHANTHTAYEEDYSETSTTDSERLFNIKEHDMRSVMTYLPTQTIADLQTARHSHTSTTLPDGTILVCGGTDGNTTLDTCERYYPDRNVWEYTGKMNSPRAQHTATLLTNGRVLIAGGTNGTSELGTSEIYNYKTGLFDAELTNMGTTHINHTATLLPNGNVFIIGGSNKTYEVFITTDAAWLPIGTTAKKISEHTATLLKDGNVAVIGGLRGLNPTNDYDIYNPMDSSQWNVNENLRVNQGNLTYEKGATIYNHKVKEHRTVLDKNGNIWVIGGNNGTTNSAILVHYIYDTATHSFGVGSRSSADFQAGMTGHTATLGPNNTIAIFGGRSVSKLSGTSYYLDAETLTLGSLIDSASNKPLPRYNHTTVMDADGYFVMIGGFDENNQPMKSVQRQYFTSEPDNFQPPEGSGSERRRRPLITGINEASVKPGDNITLFSTGTYNKFHGFSEAGDGHAVHHNTPRLVLQQMDNASGFLVDISTYMYAADYTDPDWETMISSITAKTPCRPGTTTECDTENPTVELPWGYYYAVESVNGQFTNLMPVQIGQSFYLDPVDPESITPVQGDEDHPPLTYNLNGDEYGIDPQSGYAIYTSSLVWRWDHLISDNHPNKYEVFNATDSTTGTSLGIIPYDVSVDPFEDGKHSPYLIQTGLVPNSLVQISVQASNSWVDSELSTSTAYYTKASTAIIGIEPTFDTARLDWATDNINAAGTCYQVEWCKAVSLNAKCFDNIPNIVSSGTFSDADFSKKVCYSNTTYDVKGLSPVTGYSFRVKAINGMNPNYWADHSQAAGYETNYFWNGEVDPLKPQYEVSTMTVASVEAISAIASTWTVTWTWDPVSSYNVDYEIYEVIDSTTGASVFITTISVAGAEVEEVKYVQSTTRQNATVGPLIPNSPYQIKVHPVLRYGGEPGAQKCGDPGVVCYDKSAVSISTVAYTMASVPGNISLVAEQLNTSLTQAAEKRQRLIASWEPNGNPNNTDYYVVFSTSPESDVPVFYLFTTSTSVTVDEFNVNARYSARVMAVNKRNYGTAWVVSPLVSTYANPPLYQYIAANDSSGLKLAWDVNNNPTILDEQGNAIGTKYKLSISTASDSLNPYSVETTTDSYQFGGLLTSTTYYIKLSAENLDGVRTSSVTTSTVTVAGPSGTEPGSIVGTIDPTVDTTITGTLPDGSEVSIFVPAGTYTKVVNMAIKSTDTDYCHQYSTIGNVIALAITTDDPDPLVPVTVGIKYTESTAEELQAYIASHGLNPDHLTLARYNGNADCLPLTTTINTKDLTMNAAVNTFDYTAATASSATVIQLILNTPPKTLSDARVYPNPFYPNRGDGYVSIEPVPADTKLTLYTLSGAKVWEGNSGRSALITWDGKNKKGHPVASGIYLGVLDSPSGKKKIKIAVER